ncbi:MAG TPA: histidine phosphatase family protein [bacterium]|nr:histidine phosphatase family protein [bacterium]HPT29981.1 histidine phosphatase family protein [bacterium]
MSVKIIYFVHGTTTDNETDKCTGWAGGELSELGIRQAKDLKDQITEKDFSVMFCSDLKRAVDSAHLGFDGYCPIIQDERLRECNYGDLTQADEHLVNYSKQIDTPFPNGESMKDVERRIRNFLNYLKENYDGQFIAIMAHKAPQLALEVILNGQTWEQAIEEDWRNRKAWQPGWVYKA